MASPGCLPWVEKYRPRGVSDIRSQDEIVAVLRGVVQGDGRDLPHLLLHGPPGTGKTSAALALCRDLFGQDLLSKRLLELNASDERGIQVVREKIKAFAHGAVGHGTQGAPPFKIVILDEADAITSDAQTALRRTMELYSKVTRFILVCNYVTKVIDPLASRCAKFRFKPIPSIAILDTLKAISQAENFVVDDDALAMIVDTSEGDLRQAITMLQSAYMMVEGDEGVTLNTVSVATCIIPDDTIGLLVRSVVKSPSAYKEVKCSVEGIARGGYPVSQVVYQLVSDLTSPSRCELVALRDIQKAAIALRLAETEKSLADGADEEMQVLDLGLQASMTSQNPDRGWRRIP